MIELCVAPYCHKCSKFRPEAITIMYADDDPQQTTVFCEERLQCEQKMHFQLDDYYHKTQQETSHE